MKKFFINVLSSITLVLLVLGFLSITSDYTEDFTKSIDSFSVSYNGESISTFDNTLTFETGTEHRFTCGYLLNISLNSNVFTYTITPYVINGNDFSFTVNEKEVKYCDVGDLTDCFDISADDNGFTIKIAEDFTMQKLLLKKYPGSTFVLGEYRLDVPMFCLTIMNSDKSIKYDFKFNVIKPLSS